MTSAAGAALEARLSISPSKPRLGRPVTIFLRPYWPYVKADGSCCRLVPAKVRYPFRLQALGRSGRNVIFRPKRTDDPYVWSARFMFSPPGGWEIRVTNYYINNRCQRPTCFYFPNGPRLVIHVRR